MINEIDKLDVIFGTIIVPEHYSSLKSEKIKWNKFEKNKWHKRVWNNFCENMEEFFCCMKDLFMAIVTTFFIVMASASITGLGYLFFKYITGI